MTPEIAGVIAWAVLGVFFTGLAGFVVGLLQRRGCEVCEAQLRYQVAGQKAACREREVS